MKTSFTRFCFVIVLIVGLKASAQNSLPHSGSGPGCSFVRAGKVLFYDDFSYTAIGSLPDNWELHSYSGWRLLDSSKEGANIIKVDGVTVLRAPDGHMEFIRPFIRDKICDTCFTSVEFDYRALDTDKVEMHLNCPFGSKYETATCAVNRKGTVNIGYLKNCEMHTPNEHVEQRYREYQIPGGYDAGALHHFSADFYKHKLSVFIDNRMIFCDEPLNIDLEDINFENPSALYAIRIGQAAKTNSFDSILSGSSLPCNFLKFYSDKPDINKKYLAGIKQLSEWLMIHPETKIKITLYAKSENEPAAQNLATARAAIVSDCLIRLGVKPNQFLVTGFPSSVEKPAFIERVGK